MNRKRVLCPLATDKGGAMSPFRPWQWPHPQSWREAYAVILTMLVGFLALAYALDWLKQVLGRWP